MKENIKKTRDKSKKRNMIIQGAIKGYMEYGYKNVSMDIIAELAGVSKKTVYNHFMSKENVILTIVSQYLEGKSALKEIYYDNSKPIEEQLMSFANAELYLVNTPERLGLARVLTLTFLEDQNLAYRIVMEFEPNHLKFIQWLKEAITDNKLVIDDLESAASIFYGLIEGSITYPALFQKELNVKYSQIILKEIITTFLCRYKKQ
ncbi:MAG: TetR/AcrR family transcriptional regulator [Tenericutes bacterium]|nr:TetR/AcrR family transcriptional regulator [Mycoplasmatota bacterium]